MVKSEIPSGNAPLNKCAFSLLAKKSSPNCENFDKYILQEISVEFRAS